jgi:hypothetical protein
VKKPKWFSFMYQSSVNKRQRTSITNAIPGNHDPLTRFKENEVCRINLGQDALEALLVQPTVSLSLQK